MAEKEKDAMDRVEENLLKIKHSISIDAFEELDVEETVATLQYARSIINVLRRKVTNLKSELMLIEEDEEKSSFTSYDTRNGQCGLCGSFHCSGNCFK